MQSVRLELTVQCAPAHIELRRCEADIPAAALQHFTQCVVFCAYQGLSVLSDFPALTDVICCGLASGICSTA